MHGGLSAQYRCQFIFHFYNGGKDKLFLSEFRYFEGDDHGDINWNLALCIQVFIGEGG